MESFSARNYLILLNLNVASQASQQWCLLPWTATTSPMDGFMRPWYEDYEANRHTALTIMPITQ